MLQVLQSGAKSIPIKVDTLQETRQTMWRLWELARSYQRWLDNGYKRLNAFPLTDRVWNFSKYSRLRKKLKSFKNYRFMYVAMALSLSRRALRLEQKMRLGKTEGPK